MLACHTIFPRASSKFILPLTRPILSSETVPGTIAVTSNAGQQQPPKHRSSIIPPKYQRSSLYVYTRFPSSNKTAIDLRVAQSARPFTRNQPRKTLSPRIKASLIGRLDGGGLIGIIVEEGERFYAAARAPRLELEYRINRPTEDQEERRREREKERKREKKIKDQGQREREKRGNKPKEGKRQGGFYRFRGYAAPVTVERTLTPPLFGILIIPGLPSEQPEQGCSAAGPLFASCPVLRGTALPLRSSPDRASLLVPRVSTVLVPRRSTELGPAFIGDNHAVTRNEFVRRSRKRRRA